MEPLENIIDDETNSVLNSWAVKVPVAVTLPTVISGVPVKPVAAPVTAPTNEAAVTVPLALIYLRLINENIYLQLHLL